MEIYKEPLFVRYYAHFMASAYVARYLGSAIIVAMAVVVTYSTNGFWTKALLTVEAPTVDITYHALLIAKV